MAVLDKLFRWKKKPFSTSGEAVLSGRAATKVSKEPKVAKDEPRGTGIYAQVLVRPHISEKSGLLNTLNQYVFEVAYSASKREVAFAVADLYGVKPVAVNMIAVRGRSTRFGKTVGLTKKWKKAVITLPPGKTIDVYKK